MLPILSMQVPEATGSESRKTNVASAPIFRTCGPRRYSDVVCANFQHPVHPTPPKQQKVITKKSHIRSGQRSARGTSRSVQVPEVVMGTANGARRYSDVVCSNFQHPVHLTPPKQQKVITKKSHIRSSQRSARGTSRHVLIETDTRYILSTDCDKLVGGGSDDVKMFTKTDRTLTHREAADILYQNLPDSITYQLPYRPSTGSVYVYDDSGDQNKSEDWRADGYTWKNNGRRVYYSNGKEIQRTFFKISNQGKISDEFIKHVFRFVGNDYNNRTLIAYYGDSHAYQGLPHGNRKRNNRQHD